MDIKRRFLLLLFTASVAANTPANLNVEKKNVASVGAVNERKFNPQNGVLNDWFGFAVSLSGDRALVGAIRDSDNGIDSGAAYVFMFDGSSWNEVQKLTASDGAQDDLFGIAVSLEDDRALIGARSGGDNGVESGSAYVFDFDGNNWVESQKLTASDVAFADRFGGSVSLAGDRALIGSIGNDDDGDNSGSAYVFELDVSTWIETQKLTADDAQGDDVFGASVALFGDRALIGASGDEDNGAPSSGSAYVYDFNGVTWVESQKLLASDGAGPDFFGRSVSLAGDRALIGAFNHSVDGMSTGSAYVFDFNGVNWTETQELIASDRSSFDEFGYSVSLSGDFALVGAKRDDDDFVDTGSAYLFELQGANWNEIKKLTASDKAPSDQFGVAVSLSGRQALIGAYLDDDNGDNSGSAYVIEVDLIFASDFEPTTSGH